jgi:hypothetical protein
MKYTSVALTAFCSVASLTCATSALANHGLRSDPGNSAGCMSSYNTSASNAAALAFTPGGAYANIEACTPNSAATPIPTSVLFPDGTLNDAATVNAAYTATGGEMFQYFTGAVGAQPQAQVGVWNLSNGPYGANETEIELNGWCPGAAGGASFSFGGATFTGGCGGASPTDLLFSSAGTLVGYVTDGASGASITESATAPGWTGGGSTVSAPEIDASCVGAALTLLFGGFAVLRGSRRTPMGLRL